MPDSWIGTSLRTDKTELYYLGSRAHTLLEQDVDGGASIEVSEANFPVLFEQLGGVSGESVYLPNMTADEKPYKIIADAYVHEVGATFISGLDTYKVAGTDTYTLLATDGTETLEEDYPLYYEYAKEPYLETEALRRSVLVCGWFEDTGWDAFYYLDTDADAWDIRFGRSYGKGLTTFVSNLDEGATSMTVDEVIGSTYLAENYRMWAANSTGASTDGILVWEADGVEQLRIVVTSETNTVSVSCSVLGGDLEVLALTASNTSYKSWYITQADGVLSILDVYASSEVVYTTELADITGANITVYTNVEVTSDAVGFICLDTAYPLAYTPEIDDTSSGKSYRVVVDLQE